MTTVITHDGRFHADEVFATALLSLGFSDITVLRTRDENTLEAAKASSNTFVIDVGEAYDSSMRNFDHHHKPEDSTVASFGMVFDYMIAMPSNNRALLSLFENKLAVSMFKAILVSKIDRFDNNHDGIINKAHALKVITLQDLIGMLNNTEVEDHIAQQKSFMNAVRMAEVLISNAIVKANDMSLAEDRYNTCAHKEGVLINHNYCRGWAKFAAKEDIYTHLYMQGGQWKIVSRDDRRFPLLAQAGGVTPGKLVKKFLAIFDGYDNAITYSKAVSGYYIEIVNEYERTKTLI